MILHIEVYVVGASPIGLLFGIDNKVTNIKLTKSSYQDALKHNLVGFLTCVHSHALVYKCTFTLRYN